MWPDVRSCHIIDIIKLDTLHQVEAESCSANIRKNREGDDGVCVCVCVVRRHTLVIMVVCVW